MDGRWTGCGRAGAAEIALEEARDGGARLKVRIHGRRLEMEERDRRSVDGLWTGWRCRNSMGGGG